MDALFGQLVVLEASLALLLGFVLLWRRGVTAYVKAFTWQSLVLGAVAVTVGWFGREPELYLVAALLILVKGVAIPLGARILSVVDCFDDVSGRHVVDLFTAVGFGSPPSWVKPYHVLSGGERFRCDLARALAALDRMSEALELYVADSHPVKSDRG